MNGSRCISPPLSEGLSGLIGGRAQISSSEGAEGGDGSADGVDEVRERSTAIGEETEEARQPRAPMAPYRPTKKELEEHCVCHWPFRSWCRHCVLGRAQGTPHRARGSADRQFSRSGPPTISMDHCFLGSAEEDETEHLSPFL